MYALALLSQCASDTELVGAPRRYCWAVQLTQSYVGSAEIPNGMLNGYTHKSPSWAVPMHDQVNFSMPIWSTYSHLEFTGNDYITPLQKWCHDFLEGFTHNQINYLLINPYSIEKWKQVITPYMCMDVTKLIGWVNNLQVLK